VLFSEPKIPQSYFQTDSVDAYRRRFSALQRAENSSIKPNLPRDRRRERFSALQRAENSSIVERNRLLIHAALVSVLFSEPKIPQFPQLLCCRTRRRVSVLFSEPKIPQ